MCTITWLQREDGYEVFCNRDELKTRRPALPPRFAECAGVRYLAPIDVDGGGSWLGVNELGLSLCLINHYPTQPRNIPSLRGAGGVSLRRKKNILVEADESQNTSLIPLKGGFSKDEKFRSRGLLLTSLMDCKSTEVVSERLRREALEQYRPFILLSFEIHGCFSMTEWNGVVLKFRPLAKEDLPVTSSSFSTNAVILARKENFAKLAQPQSKLDRELLINFHRSHMPERGAHSVCMHREDAETVSFTHVLMTNTEAEIRYCSAAPCRAVKPQGLLIQQAASHNEPT